MATACYPAAPMRPFCALGALLVTFVFAPSATAVPDGPVDVYLEHLEALAGAPISLAWPAQGTVTDGFGPRWGRMHLGIDVGILTSPAVRASAPGTVTAAGYLGGYEGYGNVVIVDVGRGYTMLYAHLAATRLCAPATGSSSASRSEPRAAPARARAPISTSSSVARASRSIHPRSSAKIPAQGRLAQLGEHQLDKLGVTGSSPVPPTSRKPRLGGVF